MGERTTVLPRKNRRGWFLEAEDSGFISGADLVPGAMRSIRRQQN
jgi:hypothetical protein